MTRSELIAALAQRFPNLVRQDAEIAVAEILGAVARALSQNGRVEIRGFGSFALSYRPPRTGRSPKTGETASVPAKWVPHFKAGKALRENIK